MRLARGEKSLCAVAGENEPGAKNSGFPEAEMLQTDLQDFQTVPHNIWALIQQAGRKRKQMGGWRSEGLAGVRISGGGWERMRWDCRAGP